MSKENQVEQLIANGLRFERIVKKIENFWEAGEESIYIRYYKVDHELLEKCDNSPKNCVICTKKY